MINWLEPSLIAALTATFIMFVSYFYLYLHEKEDSLKYFSLAWLVYSINLMATLFGIKFGFPLLVNSVLILSNLLNCGFLILGIRKILGNKINIKYFITGAVVTAVLALFVIFGSGVMWKAVVMSLITGSVYVYIGIIFLLMKNRHSLYILLGINFILWGLHKYDYLLFYNSAKFTPFIYLAVVLFSLVAAQGILVLYYQRSRGEHQRDEDRLASLVDLIKLTEKKELLDKALVTAIKLTSSKYGFVFCYSEEHKEFTLNTWSEEVNRDCRVEKKLTTYKLEDTGCWGDAVRLREPFMFNDDNFDSPNRKGVPKGHVEIKKFLSVPFISNGEIVVVIGVGNKIEDYDESDIRQLTLLLNSVWKIVEIKEYQKKLEAAKKKAEESNELKSAFLANISHELRTPLNGTLGMLSLVKSRDVPSDLAVFVDMAYQSAQDMLYLVEDILSFARSANKKQEAEITGFDLIEDLKRLVEVQKLEAKSKGLSIELKSRFPELPVRTDKIKLNQIIVNLISNSIKFSERGKIRITVEKDDHLKILVADEGIGIPDDKFEKIFEPFYQLEDPFTKVHKGIGAGLAIVKSLCELLDIRIQVESEIGRGTCFTLSFN